MKTKNIAILCLLFTLSGLGFAAVCRASVEDAVTLNNDGVDLYQRGFYAASIDRFKSALTYDPANTQIYTNMGYSYMASNMPEYALDSFRKALSIDPSDLEVHNNLAICMYQMGQTDQAITEWEFILRTDPNFAQAKRNLELAYSGRKLIPEGNETYYTGSIGEPYLNYDELTDIFDRGKQAYRRGDYAKAIELFGAVLEVKPVSGFSHFYIGLSYARLGKNDDAMTHLREYLVRESTPPQSAQAYAHAEKVFKRLAQGYSYVDMLRFDDTAGGYFEEGKKAYRSGDYFRAIHFLRRTVDLTPASFSANYLLGMSYRYVGDRERAVYHLTRCLYSEEAGQYSPKTLNKLEDLLNSITKTGN